MAASRVALSVLAIAAAIALQGCGKEEEKALTVEQLACNSAVAPEFAAFKTQAASAMSGVCSQITDCSTTAPPTEAPKTPPKDAEKKTIPVCSGLNKGVVDLVYPCNCPTNNIADLEFKTCKDKTETCNELATKEADVCQTKPAEKPEEKNTHPPTKVFVSTCAACNQMAALEVGAADVDEAVIIEACVAVIEGEKVSGSANFTNASSAAEEFVASKRMRELKEELGKKYQGIMKKLVKAHAVGGVMIVEQKKEEAATAPKTDRLDEIPAKQILSAEKSLGFSTPFFVVCGAFLAFVGMGVGFKRARASQTRTLNNFNTLIEDEEAEVFMQQPAAIE